MNISAETLERCSTENLCRLARSLGILGDAPSIVRGSDALLRDWLIEEITDYTDRAKLYGGRER